MWLGPAESAEPVESTVVGAIPNSVFVKAVLGQGLVVPPREQLVDVRAKMDKNAAYFLGALLSRGAVEKNSLIIRIRCESEGVPAHREFVVDSFIPRLREATGEEVQLVWDVWQSSGYEVALKNDYFLRLLRGLAIPDGEVCKTIGAPQELLGASQEIQREFVRGVGDCCGDVDRGDDRSPRASLGFLNEGVSLLGDVVKMLVSLGVGILDVSLSPAPPNSERLSQTINKLGSDFVSLYHVNVVGRQEEAGRDHVVRMRAGEYYNKVGGYYNKSRQDKLEEYLAS